MFQRFFLTSNRQGITVTKYAKAINIELYDNALLKNEFRDK
jgi:hypothetical protein